MKASATAELLLLVAIAALAYLLYVQQNQLTDLELEVDRVRGAVGSLAPPTPSEPAAAPPPPVVDASGGAQP